MSRKTWNVRWKFGEESELTLWVCFPSGKPFAFYSHDVVHKYKTKNGRNEFTLQEKIARLIKLFDNGGTRGQKFSLSMVSYACICKKGDRLGDTNSIRSYHPSRGWYTPIPKAQLHKNQWRLWYQPMNTAKGITKILNHTDTKFKSMASAFIHAKGQSDPKFLQRYMDMDTQEINPCFLLCVYAGYIVKKQHRKVGVKNALIYAPHLPNKQAFACIDVQKGRPCDFNDFEWVSPHKFKGLSL